MKPLYEDNHLLLLIKPAGVPTQPTPSQETSLLLDAKAYLKHKYQKAGAVFLEPIHRLDKPVSGCVLFARTSKALSRLQAAMREQKIKRHYLGLVERQPPGGILEDFLVHDEYKARVVTATHSEGKKAMLHYSCIKKLSLGYLLEIELCTGRYHQIRAQLSHLGFPLIGDTKYGSGKLFFEGQIALHHAYIAFEHPVTHEYLEFRAPLPTSWEGRLNSS